MEPEDYEIIENEIEEERPPKSTASKILVILLIVLLVSAVTGVGAYLIFGRTEDKETKNNIVDNNTSDNEDVNGKQQDEDGGVFSSRRAMTHVSYLSERIGVRTAGSGSESKAADYIALQLGEYGYTVQEESFSTDEGYASSNIIGTQRGTSEGYTIIIAAHYDSGVNSKGAVDNGSGVGAVLELARVFFSKQVKPTVKFVFLGSNRPGMGDTVDCLVGSRRFLQTLGTFETDEIIGMISVDSVAQGDILALKTQESGLQRLRAKLETFANKKGIPVTLMKSVSDSDNIPFEDAQLPAVWVGWCNTDGNLVTDNLFASVSSKKIRTAAELVESFILGLTSRDLEELKY